MNFLSAVFVVVAFAATIVRLDLPDRAREAVDGSGEGLSVLRDPALDDDAKEEALQRLALRLFRLVGVLVGGSVLAIGWPLAVVWAGERAGVGSLAGTLDVLERPDFLIGTAVAGFAGWWLLDRLRGG